jgi:predicted phage terminase large subunit-like protein
LRTLTSDQRKSVVASARRELARRSYRDYLTYANPKYRHFRHTELVCETLQPIVDGEQRFIFIEMPPRHGKSMTVSESFPAYYLMNNPGKRVITASYSDTLANKFGRMNREKFLEYAPELYGQYIALNNSAKKDWGIRGESGGMISTGIGGSITGHGADLLIIDDPIRNAQDANSITIRDKIWDEWESTLSTRLHDNASVIVIMTRWHEDDLIGRLLERSPHDWHRLRLPAIAEDDNDLLGREKGEPLCAELGYGKKWAEAKKLEVGSRTWSALYQQRPAPASGTTFKRPWMQFYKVLPTQFDEMLQSWDCTFKDAESSDYVVGQVWGRIGADKYLVDQIKEKMGLGDTMKAVRFFSQKYPLTYTKLVEDKANGTAVVELLTKELPGMIAVNPEGGKVVRAEASAPDFEAGNIYLPHSSIAPWIDDYVEEFVQFPFGKHDDQVDASTQAIIRFNKPKEYSRLLPPSMSSFRLQN